MSDKKHKPPAAGTAAPTTTTTTMAPATSNAETASGLGNYESAFGGTAGGFLYGLIDDNVTADKVNGEASSAATKGIDSIGDFLLGRADPANPTEYLDALRMQRYLRSSGDFATGVGEDVGNLGLGEGISDWTKENPWGTLGIGALAAAGYIASDQDLSFDKDIGLGGSNFNLLAGGDFGTTLGPGLDAARLGLEYKDTDWSAFVQGEQRFDQDAWSLAAGYRQQADWGNLGVDVGHSHTPDRDLTTAGVNWSNEDYQAYLRAQYLQPQGGENVGTIAGGMSTKGDSPLQWTTGFEADTNENWRLDAGLSYVPDSATDWAGYVKAGAGRNETGETDASIMFGIGRKF